MWKHILFEFISISIVCSSEIVKVKDKDDFQFSINLRPSQEWWETAVFYQIYPRSFMDSNGDGCGDIQGIISKLDHLKDAGVTAAWLSPIFQSPKVDQGYDISDYLSIDPLYGTKDDLKSLIKKAKELGIKIILDFVPNHTSDEHEWFKRSVERVPEYEDYYVWHDGLAGETNVSVKSVPNNWISSFKGSAWTFNDKRQQYYYHQFDSKQPDLNYSNPRVVEEMKQIMKYWLDFGVDGFRVDAVPYLFEDPDFRDEPLISHHTEYDINNPDCLVHIHTKDIDNTFEIIYQFREVVDTYSKNYETDSKILITEAYSPIEKLILYYGSSDDTRLGAHLAFNFNLINMLKNKNFTTDDIANSINLWLVNLPKKYTSNWVLGNHDNHRVATRLGEKNVDGFNMLIALLPGAMFTYNGEEIGMENGKVDCHQGFDPQAIKDCSTFSRISRDFERTPFQWDNTKNAGFSSANETWLPVSEKAKYVNLAAQNIPELQSHYNVYKKTLKLRENFKKFSKLDEVIVIKLSETLLQIIRRRNEADYMLLFNTGTEKQRANFFNTCKAVEVMVASVNSTYKLGSIVESLVLNPHESVIVRSTQMVKNGATSAVFSTLFILSFFVTFNLFIKECNVIVS